MTTKSEAGDLGFRPIGEMEFYDKIITDCMSDEPQIASTARMQKIFAPMFQQAFTQELQRENFDLDVFLTALIDAMALGVGTVTINAALIRGRMVDPGLANLMAEKFGERLGIVLDVDMPAMAEQIVNALMTDLAKIPDEDMPT